MSKGWPRQRSRRLLRQRKWPWQTPTSTRWPRRQRTRPRHRTCSFRNKARNWDRESKGLDSEKRWKQSSKIEASGTFCVGSIDRCFLTAMDSQKDQVFINQTNDSSNWLRTIEVPTTDVFFIFCEQIFVHGSKLPTETMNASPSALNSPNKPKPIRIDPDQPLDGLVKFEADKVNQKQLIKHRSLIVS